MGPGVGNWSDYLDAEALQSQAGELAGIGLTRADIGSGVRYGRD